MFLLLLVGKAGKELYYFMFYDYLKYVVMQTEDKLNDFGVECMNSVVESEKKKDGDDKMRKKKALGRAIGLFLFSVCSLIFQSITLIYSYCIDLIFVSESTGNAPSPCLARKR